MCSTATISIRAALGAVNTTNSATAVNTLDIRAVGNTSYSAIGIGENKSADLWVV